MPRPYRPIAVANEFILKAAPNGLEHMKIQKLVYLAHGWWLGFDDAPILSEHPQVWKHGPVFKSLYNILSGAGRSPILNPRADNPFAPIPRVDDADHQALSLIEWVWRKYEMDTAYQLSDFTHKKGSPWQQIAAENNYKVPHDTVIPAARIRTYFQALALEEGLTLGTATDR